MAEYRPSSDLGGPPVDAPEADLLEQLEPVASDELLDEREPAIDEGLVVSDSDSAEADRVEQAQELPSGDDYPHGPAE